MPLIWPTDKMKFTGGVHGQREQAAASLAPISIHPAQVIAGIR
jgi:hypothetical protein